MIRYGILSTSSIAARFVSAAADSRDSVVTAIASRDLKKASEIAAAWSIPKAYGSYEELLNDPDIDVVYVSMVNSLHYKYAKMALETGHHVLCEKPLTLNEDQARDLFFVARENRRFIMEAEKVVFLPVIQKVKEIINSGVLGRITLADFSSSFSAGYNSWFTNPSMGGGPFWGNAVYSLQMLSYLFDANVKKASLMYTMETPDLENQFAVTMILDNGLLAVNKTSIVSQTNHFCFLYGEKGHIEIPSYWKARTASVFYEEGTREEISFPCEHELVYEIDHVSECIRSGLLCSPVMTENRSVSTVQLLNKLRNEMITDKKTGNEM